MTVRAELASWGAGNPGRAVGSVTAWRLALGSPASAESGETR